MAFRLGGKIVDTDLLRSAFRPPRPPRVLKGSHQFLLLGVNRDHRIPAGPKQRFLPVIDVCIKNAMIQRKKGAGRIGEHNRGVASTMFGCVR